MNEVTVADRSAHWLWLVAPSAVVGLAMLVVESAWLAIIALHSVMIAALIVHRGQMEWRRAIRLPTDQVAVFIVAFFSVAPILVLFVVATRHAIDGPWLDARLDKFGLGEATRHAFAFQLCLLNPLLEELFWRGLFLRPGRRPAATDLAYAAYHFFALLPFLPLAEVAIATGGLVLVGYALRQLVIQGKGSILAAILWHALADLAVVIALGRLGIA